ncbi:hypothetical protein R3P38DRAFT_3351236 [Favolaschia claudopus]|uniref:Uncharacterized protein n=1 Tax=Favolaschia claudopus TaxID=2862362 RepID=A0AAW0C7K0_9AGAR
MAFGGFRHHFKPHSERKNGFLPPKFGFFEEDFDGKFRRRPLRILTKSPQIENFRPDKFAPMRNRHFGQLSEGLRLPDHGRANNAGRRDKLVLVPYHQILVYGHGGEGQSNVSKTKRRRKTYRNDSGPREELSHDVGIPAESYEEVAERRDLPRTRLKYKSAFAYPRWLDELVRRVAHQARAELELVSQESSTTEREREQRVGVEPGDVAVVAEGKEEKEDGVDEGEDGGEVAARECSGI